ncbi:MAG TPA: GGDEF domain-containing protein, partial [Thermotogota bacterium]|nr:GGDEF domain-containing protein [Thermotogota bacterium]
MKYKSQVGILISAVILAGILAIVMINFAAYSKIIREDILNISKLTSTSIFSKISNELTKPIFISLTMANDSFVKDWLLHEKERDAQEIITYLEGIQEKYQYNSSFLVSTGSKKYFHYQGLFKTLSISDTHDVWFFDFLEKQTMLEIDVDHDEVDQNTLTLF